MTRFLIRTSLIALLVGFSGHAFSQDNSGLSDEEILLNGGVVVKPGVGGRNSGSMEEDPSGDTVVGPAPGIEGVPEEQLPRKRRQRQPAPDTNELPISPEDPPIVDDGGNPEGEVLPKRRQRPPVVDAPAPGPDLAGPSAVEIERSLDVEPRIRLRPSERVTIREFERRPDLRRAAPSIDIQAINFEFGSSEVPYSQYRKVENIAIAMERLLRRDPDTTVLIEGHTDAVGSYGANQVLSERRAYSLKRVLVREFGIPADALETVGYGEEYLLVPTTRENWRNRRVTLRSIGDFLR